MYTTRLSPYFTMNLNRLFVCSIRMPNRNKNNFFCQQYPKQIYLKFYTVKMNYPKYMLLYKYIKIFSSSPWLSWTEKTLSFLIKKNKDNKMFLTAFSVLVLCIWPCFLYLHNKDNFYFSFCKCLWHIFFLTKIKEMQPRLTQNHKF